jgi:hypothetical protein
VCDQFFSLEVFASLFVEAFGALLVGRNFAGYGLFTRVIPAPLYNVYSYSVGLRFI